MADNDDIDPDDTSIYFHDIFTAIPNFPGAKCKGRSDAHLWEFSLHSENKVQARARRRKAIRICSTCPHLLDCREWARDHQETGVWGGEIFPPEGSGFLKCQFCKKPMVKHRAGAKRVPKGHVLMKREDLCVPCYVRIVNARQILGVLPAPVLKEVHKNTGT